MLKARESIRTLKEYQPPLSDRRGLRLDFNENTAGCSPRVLEALRGLSAPAIATYPNREIGEQAVAEYLQIKPQQILLSNGVDEALHLVAQTYLEPGDEVIIPVPSFAMYEIYARAAGAKIISIPAERDFQFPLARILETITSKTKLIAIANPNNPTGQVATNKALRRLAEAAPNAALLIDEAYFDFYGKTMLNELDSLPNLIITRTFSKAYGMAGLRIGAAIAHAEQIKMLRKAASPYNVNGVALACLPAALGDQSYIRHYVSNVMAGRASLEAFLSGLGIKYWPSQANFVLARLGALRVPFMAAMRERGILVRDRHSDSGCKGCVRITLGTGEHNAQLLRAVREVIGALQSKEVAS
jgi:histidinol-phosphate aminotransferase